MRQYPIYVLFQPFIVLFFLLFSVACDRESVEPSNTDLGYIRGSFGSQHLNFTEPFYNQRSDEVYEPEVFSNMYFYGPNQSQTNLIRNDAKKKPTKSIQIYLDVKLDTLQVPYEFSSLNSNPGSASLQLMDLAMSQDPAFGGVNDPYNYYGASTQDLKVIVTDKTNDVLKGTFEGTITTRTGVTKVIKNGEFKVRVIRQKNG